MELRIHPALHDEEVRVFSPHASTLCHSTYVRLWWERSRRHNSSNIFAVTVVVVALGRSLYFLFFLATS